MRMSEDWEYIEEEIAAQKEREKQERYECQPEICKRCRWLDWYYAEDCVHTRLQEKDSCPLFLVDIKRHPKMPIRLLHFIWHWQWRLWEFITWRYTDSKWSGDPRPVADSGEE
jgi:hypothetical protein